MSIPADAARTNVDAGTDDPKQGRADINAALLVLNALMAHLRLSTITAGAAGGPAAPGDGLEYDAGGNTLRLRSGVSVKRVGTNGPPEVAVPINAQTAAYTAVAADRGKLIDATGTWTLGLTAAATLGADWFTYVRNSGSGVITIDPASTELINGAATLILRPGQGVIVICTGATFRAIGRTDSKFFSGTITRNLATASGNVGTTAVGFKPKTVIFLGFVGSTLESSWGFDDGAAGQNMAITGSTGVFGTGAAGAIVIIVSGGNNQIANIVSFDDDGFTLGWVKTGLPTGSATIRFLAIGD